MKMRMLVQGCNKLKMPQIWGDKESVDVAAPLFDEQTLLQVNWSSEAAGY